MKKKHALPAGQAGTWKLFALLAILASVLFTPNAYADLGDTADDYEEAKAVPALVRSIRNNCRPKCDASYKRTFSRMKRNALTDCSNTYGMSNATKAGKCRTAVRRIKVQYKSGSAAAPPARPAARRKTPRRRRCSGRKPRCHGGRVLCSRRTGKWYCYRKRRRRCAADDKPNCQNGTPFCNRRTGKWGCDCDKGWDADSNGICTIPKNPPPRRADGQPPQGRQGTTGDTAATGKNQPGHFPCFWFWMWLVTLILLLICLWYLRKYYRLAKNNPSNDGGDPNPSNPSFTAEEVAKAVEVRISEWSNSVADLLASKVLSKDELSHELSITENKIIGELPEELDLRTLQLALRKGVKMSDEEFEALEAEMLKEAEEAQAAIQPQPQNYSPSDFPVLDNPSTFSWNDDEEESDAPFPPEGATSINVEPPSDDKGKK